MWSVEPAPVGAEWWARLPRTSMGPGVLEGSSVFLLSGGPGAAFLCARMKGDRVIVYIRLLAHLRARLLLDWGRLTEGLADGAGVS